LALRVEKISRNFGENRLFADVFIDIDKAFDTIWFDDLLYKLTILNFRSYLVQTISSYPGGLVSEASIQTATISLHAMRADVALGGLISLALFIHYVNDTL
jgi:hypothetical protein